MRSFFRLLVASTLVTSLLACKKHDVITVAPPTPPPPLTFTVTTLAGGSATGYAEGTGAAAQFNNAIDLAVDQQGNVYVIDDVNQRIRKVTPAGVVSTLAGSGLTGRADGAGTTAQFNNPSGIAVDAQGLVYVADSNNSLIRVITPAGVVSTLTGMAGQGLQDGPVASAKFFYPNHLAFDQQGNLYVSEIRNNRIRKVTPAGVVSTLAGGEAGVAAPNGYADGPATAARFATPEGLAVDKQGNVYVADVNNNRIRKVTPAGVVSTVAGSGDKAFADGRGTQAKFSFPVGIVVDAQGTLYVTDYNNGCLRRIGTDGQVSVAVGSDKGFGPADGTGPAAQFTGPQGLAISASGQELYVADYTRIRKAVGR